MCLDGIKSLDDYLQKYGQHLADRARESLRPLHTPGVDPVHPVVAEFIRAPFEAQAHVITGAAKALKRDKGIFIVGEMGTGKAQPLDAKVLTPDGWKRMGDMHVGDEVVDPVDPKGGSARILGVYPQGEKDVYRVTFSDGSWTECCDDHLWSVNTPERRWRSQPPKVMPLKEIRRSYLGKAVHSGGANNRRYFIPLVSPCEHPHAELPVDPYLLGVLLGDGHLRENCVSFSSMDEEIVESVASLIPAGLSIKRATGCDYRISGERFSPNPLTDALRSMGLAGKLSNAKFVPDQYLFASVEQRVSVLQGLLDTDGSVDRGYGIEFVTVSPQLAQDVASLVQSLGGTAKCSTKETRYSHKGESLVGQKAHRLYVILPPDIQPFRLTRKLSAYRPGKKYGPTRAIASIDFVGAKECQCIALDSSSKLYITDDYIVTHNTLMGECGVHAHANGRPYRALIFCPGHLPEKWKREIQQTIPGAKVKIIAHWTDALKLWDNRKVPPTGPEWFIVSQNTAKLGAKWNALKGTKIRGVDHVVMKCPACGHVQRDKEDVPLMAKAFAGKMKFCEGKVTNPLRAKGERVCGQALWTYNATLRKWDAARFFHKKLHHFFDYFIVDEVHEEKGDATAQATAMGACIAASKRVVALTGTLIGGYAEHLRPLLFRICPRTLVEEGLKWTDSMLFAERYGKIETRISTRSGGSDSGDEGTANKQSRGSSGGRSVTRVIRPGIMPTIFGRHLMGNTVFLLLDEVAENLPELEESIVRVPMDGHLKVAYEAIESKLADAIKSLIKSKGPGGAGKLLGPMLNALLCYPDHPFAWKPIGYTDRDSGFIMVAEPETLDVDRVYAKEQALIDDVLADYRMGRQCWVFCEYNGEHNVQGRMADMLRNQGLRVTELRANIPLVDREAWIAKHGPNYDVILSNPNLVKTGLDLFDKGGKHNFSSLFFYETGTNLFTLRQASRRAWRIGQMAKCKVKYYFYEETMQERIMALMGKKMAAATAIDGRFTTEGLVGMAEDDSIEVAMAKSLADNMQEDASRHWAKIGAGEGPTISMDGGDGFFDDLASFLDSVAL